MTARVALVGWPLRRRHSEVMHNAAFAHFGIDCRYEVRPTEPDRLADFFAEARGPRWLGFQVTSPHKQTAMGMVDEVEQEAREIGAINSGVRTGHGTLIGFNTDSPGFARSVENDLGMSLAGARVVVAGAGGAARAVVHACLAAGADEVHVGNRTAAVAAQLGADLGDPRISAGGLDAGFDDALGLADLVVNATTVGMTSSGLPFDVGLLPSRACVFDLVYVPPATDLVTAATERGLRAVNGIGMLVAQAAVAFERWTGIADPDAVMRGALDGIDTQAETEGDPPVAPSRG